MKRSNLLLAALVMVLVLTAPALASGPGAEVSPDAALTMLQDGNARFVAGKPKHPHQNKERRVLTATKGQAPFATILSCSDSRAPVELIFDSFLRFWRMIALRSSMPAPVFEETLIISDPS